MGSGKTTVGNWLSEAGETVLEIDKLTAKLYEQDEIRIIIQDRFGLTYFNNDGSVKKRKLAEVIFAEEEERKFLERVFWPRLRQMVELWFYKQECRQKTRVFVIVPLLFEAGWQKMFDEVWLVTAPREEILMRLQVREKIDYEEAQRRLQTQIPDDKKSAWVQQVLENNGDQEELKKQVQVLLSQDR